MSDEDPPTKGVSFSISEKGVSAEVGDRTVARLGSAAGWLFPKRTAKVVITEALAQRVATKIREGDLLDSQEQAFVALLFEKEARKLANQQAIVERVSELLPEISSQMRSLPEHKDRGTSPEFIGRAETIAGEIGDSSLRDMFARVLAGEVSRPGAFSLRTLETVRMMDRNVAEIFEKFRKLLFDAEYIIDAGKGDDLIREFGFSLDDQLELQDAGLLDESVSLFAEPGSPLRLKYGDRVLRIAARPKAKRLWVSTIRLTRPARELASVLPPSYDPVYFQRVGLMLTSEFPGKGGVSWRLSSAKALHPFVEAAQPADEAVDPAAGTP
jgi:hypothetical protein